MSFFSAEELARIVDARADVENRFKRLQQTLLSRKFKSERAQEYARQGLGRRIDEMNRAIEFIFDILPPEQEAAPETYNRVVTTMLLQSYFMNVQGCLDNIAWIWVYETNQKDRDGGTLKRGLVGLGDGHRYLMRSFSCSFRAHIRGLRKWFRHVAEFRDSAAHRIPLYVPPYFILGADASEYERLGREASSAYQRDDFDAYDKFRERQDALGRYRPIISHSPVEGSPSCVFHKQVLQDFMTIDEITQKLLVEIDNFKPNVKPSWINSILTRFWGRA